MHNPSLCIKFYFGSQKALQRVFILLRACLTGFWLGVLRRETIHCIDKNYYDDPEKNYFSEKYNQSGLKDWEQNFLDEYFAGRSKLLVTSVGGGRESLALQKAGYDVQGFECHPQLVEYANSLLTKEGLTPNIKLAPRDRCPVNGRSYDGAIIGWGAFMLIQGRQRRIQFLKDIRVQSHANGPILLSFFSRSYDSRYLKVVALVANGFRTIFGRERVDLGDDLVPNFVHHFTQKEIAAELMEAGFELSLFSDKGYTHAVGIAVDQAQRIQVIDKALSTTVDMKA